MEKAIKLTRDKKAVRDDNICGDVLRILGEDGLRMAQLINNMYGTGGWPKDVTEVKSCWLKAEARSCKMQRPSHVRPDRPYGAGSGEDTWNGGLKGTLTTYLEKISGFRREKGLGMQFGR